VLVEANPVDTDELDLEADERAVAAAINDLQKRAGAIDPVVVKNATPDKLLSAVSGGADVFHFAGHGVFEAGEPDAGGAFVKKGKILLERPDGTSERYDSEQLAVVLGNAGVRLAVLGACNSAARDAGGAWTGVAPALVRQNVPAVVAMQYKVRDHNAATFLAHVYARALAGYTIDEAVFAGRQAVFNRTRGEEQEWGVPVLYLRAGDGVLFPAPPAGEMGGGSARVDVQLKLATVRGEVIGADIGTVLEGRISVNQVIDTVESGGRVMGVKIGTLGGPPRTPSDRQRGD
jgi:hypothetical protein